MVQKCYLLGAKKINTIPITPDTFLSFEVNQQEYKGSFQFLSESLDTLINALGKSHYDFPNTRKM